MPKVIPKPPICIACNGTGRSSNNRLCVPCCGTGRKQEGKQ